MKVQKIHGLHQGFGTAGLHETEIGQIHEGNALAAAFWSIAYSFFMLAVGFLLGGGHLF